LIIEGALIIAHRLVIIAKPLIYSPEVVRDIGKCCEVMGLFGDCVSQSCSSSGPGKNLPLRIGAIRCARGERSGNAMVTSLYC